VLVFTVINLFAEVAARYLYVTSDKMDDEFIKVKDSDSGSAK